MQACVQVSGDQLRRSNDLKVASDRLPVSRELEWEDSTWHGVET